MNKRPMLHQLGAAAVFVAAAYGIYAGVTWLRYGRRRPARRGEADPLLDALMPEFEVLDRHHLFVDAPAEITLAAACVNRL